MVNTVIGTGISISIIIAAIPDNLYKIYISSASTNAACWGIIPYLYALFGEHL